MNIEATVPAETSAGLEAILEIDEEIPRREAVSMQFKLVNQADEALLVLNWYTPLEGLAGDIFRVGRNGKPVPYQGILAKRGIPQPDEYVLLRPGESVSAAIDLATGYDFLVPGDYTIEYLSPAVSQVVRQEAEIAKRQRELGPVRILSNPITVRIFDSGEDGDQTSSTLEDTTSPPHGEGTAAEEATKIKYDNCSSSEEDIVSSADVGAQAKLCWFSGKWNFGMMK